MGSGQRRMRAVLALGLRRVAVGGGLLSLVLSLAWTAVPAAVRTRMLHQLGVRHVSSARLAGADLSRARLPDSHFGDGQLAGADLRGAELTSATFVEADLRRARLQGADLRHANLIDADLRGAQLGDAQLDDAWLSGSDLRGADLGGARLERTWLMGADLRESRGLTQPQLDRACGDGSTRLPAGLRVPHCP